jgi:parallel beta-helix repeat protein
MKWAAVLVSVCVLALAASACFGGTITVPGDHATIGAAVAAASDGDLINVSPGTYTENVVVDKAVVIRAVQGSDVTTVTAASSANRDCVFMITASDVTLSGFTISGATGLWGAGVSIDGYDYATANDFTACISDVTLSKCVIENNTIGVLVALADGSMIINNTIRSNQDYPGRGGCCFTNGITLCNCPDLPSTLGTQIVNNGIYQNDGNGVLFMVGASLWDLAGTKIFGNSFYENGNSDAGSLEWACDITVWFAAGRIKVAGNKFVERIVEGWPMHGFWAYDAPDAKVVGNPEREELGPNIPMPTP